MITKSSKLMVLMLALTGSLLVSPTLTLQPAVAKADASAIQVTEEQIDHKPFQVTHVLVKTRPDQVWQVLTDYNSAPAIFPTLKKCRVLSDKGQTKVIHYQIKPTGSITSFEYDLEMKETPQKSLEWRRVGGDFKDVEGYWKLEPVDCGRSTMVTYATYCNGGVFLPQALIKRQSRIDLPQVMTALKVHAETTTQIAATRAPRSPNN